MDFNLSFLRQEENMYLACPPSVAKHLPEPIQELVGYTMAGYSFGYFAEYKHPREAFDANRPINWATEELVASAGGGGSGGGGTPPRSRY